MVDRDEERGAALAEALAQLTPVEVNHVTALKDGDAPDMAVLVEPDDAAEVASAVAAVGGEERHTVVLPVVSSGSVSDAAAYMRAGADDVVWPPVRTEEMLLRMETCRESRRARAEIARLRLEALETDE